MKKGEQMAFRRASLLTTAVAALGVALILPIKKVWAASFGARVSPAAVGQPKILKIRGPRYVNPTAMRLLHLAAQALSNNALAQRIFSDPDAVAKQYHLSKAETRVLHHMDRRQFQTARSDAARLVAQRRAEAGTTPLPANATNTQLITEGMIVGRAILAAVGRSYLNAKDHAACCTWGGTLELGINADPAYYNSVFQNPAHFTAVRLREAPRAAGRVNLPAVQAPRTGASLPAVQAPRTGVAAPQPAIKVLRPGENRLK
jgi:hypothetical protein